MPPRVRWQKGAVRNRLAVRSPMSPSGWVIPQTLPLVDPDRHRPAASIRCARARLQARSSEAPRRHADASRSGDRTRRRSWRLPHNLGSSLTPPPQHLFSQDSGCARVTMRMSALPVTDGFAIQSGRVWWEVVVMRQRLAGVCGGTVSHEELGGGVVSDVAEGHRRFGCHVRAVYAAAGAPRRRRGGEPS